MKTSKFPSGNPNWEQLRRVSMTKVYIINGSMQGRHFALKERSALIGRGPKNDIQIDESSVSRKHAKIFGDGGKYFIEDLRSKNGTWINGNAVESGEKVELQEGIPIALGNILISLGKRCPSDCVPNQYSMNLSYLGDEVKKDHLREDRRARNRENLELVYRLCLTLMQSLDVKEMCKKILSALMYCLKRIDAGYILLVDSESGELKEIAAQSRDGKDNAEKIYSKTIVNRALKGRKAIMMPDTSLEDEENLSDSLETMGVKSLMCVPLISKTGTRGVIYVHSVKVAHGFRKDDLFFLTGVSTPAALALENALLHARSKQAEKELQKVRDDLENEVHNRTVELVIANRQLEELSITDGLTGLYNYRYLMERLKSEYNRALRYDHSLALLMIDIDNFKELNDRFGHLCGDFIIKNIAMLLQQNIRTTDLIARYGGDEIAIILLEASKKTTLEVAEKLRAKVENFAFEWEGKPLNVTISIGAVALASARIENWKSLLSSADRALYQAKKANRNTVIAFAPEGKNK
jgi:diguanylate cyclase (GGDEF)-like protein